MNVKRHIEQIEKIIQLKVKVKVITQIELFKSNLLHKKCLLKTTIYNLLQIEIL